VSEASEATAEERRKAKEELSEEDRMATDPVEPRHDRRGEQALNINTSIAAAFDPALDPTIRHLFEQQAEIQAKLAALLPAKYVPNSKLELDMLRLKLRALETYAENTSQFFSRHAISSHSISPNPSVANQFHKELLAPVPILSEIEEARALQYRCECIESSLIDQGKMRSHSLPQEAPSKKLLSLVRCRST
jgi:hypothetical protein